MHAGNEEKSGCRGRKRAISKKAGVAMYGELVEVLDWGTSIEKSQLTGKYRGVHKEEETNRIAK